jgi:hypothetical protein
MRSLSEETAYDLLGISPSAEQKEIQEAFTLLRKEMGSKDARRLREARDRLWSPERRAVLDAFLPQLDDDDTDTDKIVEELLGDLPAAEDVDWFKLIDKSILHQYEADALARAVLHDTWLANDFARMFPVNPPSIPIQAKPERTFKPAIPAHTDGEESESDANTLLSYRRMLTFSDIDVLIRDRAWGTANRHLFKWNRVFLYILLLLILIGVVTGIVFLIYGIGADTGFLTWSELQSSLLELDYCAYYNVSILMPLWKWMQLNTPTPAECKLFLDHAPLSMLIK